MNHKNDIFTIDGSKREYTYVLPETEFQRINDFLDSYGRDLFGKDWEKEDMAKKLRERVFQVYIDIMNRIHSMTIPLNDFDRKILANKSKDEIDEYLEFKKTMYRIRIDLRELFRELGTTHEEFFKNIGKTRKKLYYELYGTKK